MGCQRTKNVEQGQKKIKKKGQKSFMDVSNHF